MNLLCALTWNLFQITNSPEFYTISLVELQELVGWARRPVWAHQSNSPTHTKPESSPCLSTPPFYVKCMLPESHILTHKWHMLCFLVLWTKTTIARYPPQHFAKEKPAKSKRRPLQVAFCLDLRFCAMLLAVTSISLTTSTQPRYTSHFWLKIYLPKGILFPWCCLRVHIAGYCAYPSLV